MTHVEGLSRMGIAQLELTNKCLDEGAGCLSSVNEDWNDCIGWLVSFRNQSSFEFEVLLSVRAEVHLEIVVGSWFNEYLVNCALVPSCRILSALVDDLGRPTLFIEKWKW